MSIKIDVHTISNAQGEGVERIFPKVMRQSVLTEHELAREIEHTCTVTESDILAVLTALSSAAKRELSEKGCFYLPRIGYFALSAHFDPDFKGTADDAKGSDVTVCNINFRPESRFLRGVKEHVRFTRSKTTTVSRKYSEEEMEALLDNYFAEQEELTIRTMQRAFGLSNYMAKKWTALLLEKGYLRKVGSDKAPTYVKKN